MQLDKTRIVVRERSLFEVMDLALRVCRDYARPIAITLLLGALPCASINFWLIGWMASPDYLEYASTWIPFRYCWTLTLLTFIEAPLATSLITAFLGKAVFEEAPSLRQTLRDVGSCAGKLLWFQATLRGVIPAWLLLLGVAAGADYTWNEFLLILLTLYLCFPRAARSYLNEIVLLEQNPWRSRDRTVNSVASRNVKLHSPSSGDLIARWLGGAWMFCLLSLAAGGNLVFLKGVFTGSWRFSWEYVILLLPIGLWIVCGFAAVVRFFSYIDLRIRHEGWEVELRMKAEAARLAGPAIAGAESE